MRRPAHQDSVNKRLSAVRHAARGGGKVCEPKREKV
jgi:hypothetical protein